MHPVSRAEFPRGLSQPDTGFRFSLDALLLAAFAGRSRVRGRVLDLGTGCGVVGLAMALHHPDFLCLGLDRSPDMLAHARRNIERLGLTERFALVCSDVSAVRQTGVRPESVDLVVCNPPYRQSGTGRVNPDAHRAGARFEEQGALEDFVSVAAWAVRNRGNCMFVHLAERLDDLLVALRRCRLSPRELVCLHPRADEPARLVLVRAMKNGGRGLVVQPPLVLHEGRGRATRLSAAVLEFCPQLACNAGV